MRNLLGMILLLCVIGGANPAYSQAAPSHLKYFGFYLVDCFINDPHDTLSKTDYTSEVAAYSNIAHLHVWDYTNNIVSRVQSMNAQCVKPFVSIQGIFWHRVDANATSGNHYELLPDYLSRWNAFKATNASVLDSSHIEFFYVSDEPTYNGITYAELNTICALLKNDVPDIKLSFVEAYVSLGSLVIPPTVDCIGFDRYAIFDPATNGLFLSDVATLKSKLRPNQTFWLTIDDQWLPLFGTLGYTPAMMEPVIQQYYDIAASEPLCSGLLGYLWPGGFDQPEQLGVRDMPQAVIDLNVSIGTRIKASYSPCRECDAFTSEVSVTHESCVGCGDGQVELTLSGGTSPISYSWTNGQTTGDLSSLSPGVYSVTATDAEGCRTVASAVVKTTYRILRTPSAPAIDGDIGEFRLADSVSFANSSGSRATVKALWDTSALYVGARMRDGQLIASATTRDTEVWNEDALEIFVDCANNEGATMGADDRQFLLNILNTQCDVGAGAGLSWDGTWLSSVAVLGTTNSNSDIDSGYLMELRIPWSTLGQATAPAAAHIVGLDFAFDDKSASGMRSVQWPGNTTTFTVPAQWQKGVLSGTSIAATANKSPQQQNDRPANLRLIYSPAVHKVVLYTEGFQQQVIEVIITSMNGQVITSQNVRVEEGSSQYSVAVPVATHGVYLVRMMTTRDRRTASSDKTFATCKLVFSGE